MLDHFITVGHFPFLPFASSSGWTDH